MSNDLLLDTCAFIWVAAGGSELSDNALECINKAATVYVSAISSFEISLKYKTGGIELPCDPERWFFAVLENHDISEIPVDSKIMISSTKLPDVHKDSCDRFIIATAMINSLTIVTTDKIFSNYHVNILK